VLRAPSAARANLAKSLIAKLDQPTAELGNVHVVYLKNAEATKLAQTLRSVMSGDTSAATATGVQSSGQPGQNQSSMSQSSGSSSSSSGGPSNPLLSNSSQQQQAGGGSAGFIQADASTNTLIITAPESVYRNLRAVIDQLDVRRAQVYIESLIVEVTSDKAPNSACSGWALPATRTAPTAWAACSRTTGGTNNNIAAGQSLLARLAPATSARCPAMACRSASSSRWGGWTGRAGALAGIGRQRQHPVDAEHDHAG
jgi:general secretion pathway protein D